MLFRIESNEIYRMSMRKNSALDDAISTEVVFENFKGTLGTQPHNDK